MSNQISSQANKFWETLTSKDTVDTYKKTLDVTWAILKEGGLLIWLTICLVLVLFDWIGSTGVSLGRQTRDWFDGLQETSTDRLASNTGKAVLNVGQSSITSAISLARKQLGLPERPPEQTVPTSVVPTVTTTPPTPAPTPVPPMPSVSSMPVVVPTAQVQPISSDADNPEDS